MNKPIDIYFKDKSFPISIRKNSRSLINDADTTLQAIHEAIEIKYFYEGTSTLLIGDKTVYAEAGDIIVINPYEFHSTIDCGGQNPGRYHLFMMGLDFFEGLRSADINLRHLVFTRQAVFKTQFRNDELMQDILTRVINESDFDDQLARLSVFGLMAQFFAHLLRSGIESNNSSHNEDILHYYAVIEPAVRMIRDSYSEHFTVDMLAERCSISKFHFCRIFKTVMGTSAIQYLNNYRLKIADTMIASTDKQISEIASLVGFEDAGYFSRMYKKQFGHTPKKSKSKSV